MAFPERFSNLPEYAFPRLRALLDSHQPGAEPLAMTIGEPRHAMPPFILEAITEAAEGFARYPTNEGTPELLSAIRRWLHRRYELDHPEAQIIALNGTREGLFAAGPALIPEAKNGQRPAVLIPNPFYQVYAVATAAMGAEPVFVPATAQTGFLPDFAALPAEILNRTAAVYLCSPSNPQGAVAPRDYLRDLIALAERYDFQILADECYAEIYRDTPPPGALEIAAETGADPERVVIFHSLSKRSNLPGLRSGFAAGGPETIRRLRQLRAYGGAPLPLPLQHAAARTWDDETHVIENRRLYNEKFALAEQILGNQPGYHTPEGGFFLWLPVPAPLDGEGAALALWRKAGLRVLPGAYLAREAGGDNPGAAYIRVALVAPTEDLRRGLTALRDGLYR